jgi:chaperonin GroEL
LRNVVAGASALELKRALDRGLTTAIGVLRSLSRPVASPKEKAQVATISAHNDASIGGLVAEAIGKVGDEGVITVEEAKGTETSLEIAEGMRFDHGYLSPYFVTDSEKMEAAFEDPFILIHEKRITSVKDLLPLLEHAAKGRRPLLIVAEDVEGEALATLVVNKLGGTLSSAAVKAPGYGDRRKDMLEDLAILTGGKVLAAELGTDLEHMKPEYLGRARRAVVTRETTTIVGGAGDRKAIDGRIALLRRMIEKEKSDYDRERLQERLAKLSGGVAVIHAGAPTESEMKSRKEAFDDAISATKAAVAEGILPGGGLSLLRAAAALEKEAAKAEGDERTGLLILARALEAPMRQIAENSGVEGAVVVSRIKAEAGTVGFDASTGRYVELVEAGIIDPTKVVRVALENAVSAAGVLLLTEATLVEEPRPEEPPRPLREVE